MKTRSWLWLVGFSIAGYAATFLLFPKLTPAAHWGQKLDHRAAVIQAKEIARSLGVENIESNDWIATAQISYDPKMDSYLSERKTGVAKGLFTPLKTSVALVDPRGSRKVKVGLNSDGKLVTFNFSSPNSKTTEKQGKDEEKKPGIKISRSRPEQPSQEKQSTEVSESLRPATTVSEADKQLAESTFKSFWGEKLSSASLAESSATQQGARLIWNASDDVVKLTARVLVSEGKVTALSLEREFTPQYNQAFERRRVKFE